MLKILIIGDVACGKTSILNQFVLKKFESTYSATVACEFALKIIKIEDISIRLHLWDIAGQDRLGGISKLFCRDAAGALVVTDIKDSKTLENAITWKEQVDAHLESEGESIPMVLAVNKYDLIEQQEKEGKAIEETMTQAFLDDFCSKNGFVGCFRTSAKTGGNVTNAFSLLVRQVLKQKAEKESNENNEDDYANLRKQSIQLSASKAVKKEKKKGCC
uniref:Rab GTPase 7 n=1 Tax=Euplotoides octocarinatus TaxID=2716877 RepID=E2GMZ5_EUPOC|nr:Rab GTPase 7 [Euplotes octocarinatus]